MIREASLADIGALSALHGESFAESWSAESIGAMLATPGTFGLIAATDDEPRGFVLARAAGGEAEILTLAVGQAWRRKGQGRALVQAAAMRGHELHASVLFLEVGARNGPALRLYTALGFEQAGLRKAYYARGKGLAAEDALILKAGLPLGRLGNRAGLD
ncbi:MAG: GNAT family N-acetyltransferase [Rhizomicrobium sp.]